MEAACSCCRTEPEFWPWPRADGGRAGYLWNRGGLWSLVVRNFFVNPSGAQVDVPKHDPDDPGYGFQVCRVDEPEFGSFCELQYHAPALGALPDPTRRPLPCTAEADPAREPLRQNRPYRLSGLNTDVNPAFLPSGVMICR